MTTAPSLEEVKTRQQKTWSSGDYGKIAWITVPLAEALTEAVGLRPISPRVRVEIEQRAPDRLVVHNYGHGGAGVTLSWGCAAEVAQLVNARA